MSDATNEAEAWKRAAALAMKIAKSPRAAGDAKRLAGYVLYLAARRPT